MTSLTHVLPHFARTCGGPFAPLLVLVLLGAGLTQAHADAQVQGRSQGGQAQAGGRSRPVVVFETARGSFEIELYAEEAPRSVEHILTLVRRNFYNGLRVHRVSPGFVVQFGDPQTRDMTRRNVWGTGGSGRAIGVAEIDPARPHRPGAVALAHAGDPVRADSQIYIALAGAERYAHLEGNYAIIGQVVSGLEVVQALRETDLITRATIRGEPARPR